MWYNIKVREILTAVIPLVGSALAAIGIYHLINIVMSIKVALLKSGESVIADIKELISNDNICAYLFENPNISRV